VIKVLSASFNLNPIIAVYHILRRWLKRQQLSLPVIVINDKDSLIRFNPARLDELKSRGKRS
jgi:hypothetical protein